jgi:hypothetical protein
LRDERYVSLKRHADCKRCVELYPGVDNSKAVGADYPDAVFCRKPHYLFFEFFSIRAGLLEACRDYDHTLDSDFAALHHHLRHNLCRDCDDCHVQLAGHILYRWVRVDALDAVVLVVYGIHCSGVSLADEILHERVTYTAHYVACANNRYRFRVEYIF